MLWQLEWKAINARIGALRPAAELYLTAQLKNSTDSFSVASKCLLPQALEIYVSITKLFEAQKKQMPKMALDVIERFVKENETIFLKEINAPVMEKNRAVPLIAYLTAFASEFSYVTSDSSIFMHRLSERAFAHLQRSIVADDQMRERWKEAFQKHETRCEKLGAAHLLLHGIWAFKTSGEGERTDLVFGEPITNDTEIIRSAEAMVLTEWKLVKDANAYKNKLREALEQAKIYSSGVLWGIKLHKYRYLVLVSEKQLPKHEDIEVRDVLYRVINISVDPLIPSKQATL